MTETTFRLFAQSATTGRVQGKGVKANERRREMKPEFTIKQSYKYKHLLARQMRQFSNLSVAWSEEWSRRIFSFCGNDTVQMVKL